MFTDDKTVNSFVRKCFKENFPEPANAVEATEVKKSDDEVCEEVEVKPSHPFASRVPRFQDITIDSTGVYRRKRKTREAPVVVKKIYSAFGSSCKRNFLVTRNETKCSNPGVGVYSLDKPKKHFYRHSFGGDILIKPAFDIVCSPMNLDTNCNNCDEKPKNVFWKNKKTRAVLCRLCYNQKLEEIQSKSGGIISKLRKLENIKFDFEKKRYCDFYHQHNKTTAAVRLLSAKDFRNRINKENFLHTLFDY